MRRARLASFAIGALLAVVGVGGCEAIVGGSVGSLACVDAPGACPEGQACVGGVCTACSDPQQGISCGADSGLDVMVGVDGRIPPAMEAGATDGRMPSTDSASTHDGMNVKDADAAPLVALGQACTSNSECQSDSCGDSTLLTGLGLGSSKICTQPCCSSGDCNTGSITGFVCYPSVGGNYCVEASRVSGVGTLGTGPAGSECGSGGDCLSGACSGNGVCEDACCTDSDCSGDGGAACQFSSFEGSQNYNCDLPPLFSSGQGSECGSGGDCSSDLCVQSALPDSTAYCFGSCCSAADCTEDVNDSATDCRWALTVFDKVSSITRSCAEPAYPSGSAYKSPCTANSDCESGLCNLNVPGGLCTIPCCGTGSGTESVCGSQVCGYASFTLGTTSPVTADLQVCVPGS